MPPVEIYALTPRKFQILLRAQQERNYDDNERMATNAVWREIAHRSKRIKPSDLYKRPTDANVDKAKVQDLREQTRMDNAWLASLQTVRKE